MILIETPCFFISKRCSIRKIKQMQSNARIRKELILKNHGWLENAKVVR